MDLKHQPFGESRLVVEVFNEHSELVGWLRRRPKKAWRDGPANVYMFDPVYPVPSGLRIAHGATIKEVLAAAIAA